MSARTPSRGPNRVIVVGAGVIGATAAARIAESGSEVVLLTADEVGTTPASRASFGWVNALPKASPESQQLNRAGRRAHAGQPWFAATGSEFNGERYAEDGYVDAARYLAAQLDALTAAGGSVRQIAPLTAIAEARERHGAADAVVVAAGASTAQLLAQHPHSSTRLATSIGDEGFIVHIAAAQHPIARVQSISGLQIRPDAPGRIVAQSLGIEADLRDRGVEPSLASIWPALRAEIAAKTGWHAIGATPLRLERAVRTEPSDGLPVIGRIDGGVYVALAHSGITLAPLLGELIARDLHGDADPLLAPFRP